MSLSEDETCSPPSWLDWWLAPRWRALVTCVILAGITGEAIHLWRTEINTAISRPFRLFPMLPTALWQISGSVNYTFAFIWFEPLALRLSGRRSAAWIIIRLSPIIFAKFFLLPPWANPFSIHGWSHLFWASLSWVALGPVLRGWRSPTWMPVIGGVVYLVVESALRRTQSSIPEWLWFAARATPFIAIMLYGTRLLGPEERVRTSRHPRSNFHVFRANRFFPILLIGCETFSQLWAPGPYRGCIAIAFALFLVDFIASPFWLIHKSGFLLSVLVRSALFLFLLGIVVLEGFADLDRFLIAFLVSLAISVLELFHAPRSIENAPATRSGG